MARAVSRNPAETPGPDIGLLVDPDGPELTLVYLPGLVELAREAGADFPFRLADDPTRVILGNIGMTPPLRPERRCGNVLIVRQSWAQEGWGPLLYDSALLTAKFYGKEGVLPDRASVSPPARELWRFYQRKRPDVDSLPVPRGCEAHGDVVLDAVYSSGPTFPSAAVGRLRAKMGQSLRAAAEASGLTVNEIVDELQKTGAETPFAIEEEPARVTRAKASNPARWLEGRAANRKKRKSRKKRSFWDKPRDWDEVLLELPDRKVTRREIRDYYWDNREKIFPELKGKTVMVLFAPSTNYFLYKRHRPDRDLIKITKLRGIEDPSSYEYWVNRRVVEFHTVIGSKTDLVWVDLDPHADGFDAQLQRKMVAAIPQVIEILEKVFPKAKVSVWSSGKKGLHIEAELPTKVSTDKARKDLRRHLDKAFADDRTVTTGIARKGQIRLDVTTLKKTGSIRSRYSYTVDGGVKKPWEQKTGSVVGMFSGLKRRLLK